MTKYILLDIVSYNMKKKDEYTKYKLKQFSMQDKLAYDKDVVLDFGKDKIKSKFVSITKTNDTNKIFCIDTKSFTCIIQPLEFYNRKDEE